MPSDSDKPVGSALATSQGTVRYLNREYPFRPGDNVLDCLGRGGANVPSLCHAGTCHVCVLRVVDGVVPEQARAPLHSGARANGAFLPCKCPAAAGLQLEPLDLLRTSVGRVTSVQHVGSAALRVLIRLAERLEYRPGQVIHLGRAGSDVFRPFVISSLPRERELEIHVERRPCGKMSEWLAGAAGHEVIVKGVEGTFFYMDDRSEPLYLVGIGAGVAAIVGVLRDALAKGHQGPIHLVHTSSSSGVGCREEIVHLTDSLGARLRRVEHTVEPDTPRPYENAILADVPPLFGFRTYLAGPPLLVRRLKLRAFGHGADPDRIHTLAFKPFRSLGGRAPVPERTGA